MLRLLVRILGRDAELEDVLHEVFVRALSSIESLQDPSCRNPGPVTESSSQTSTPLWVSSTYAPALVSAARAAASASAAVGGDCAWTIAVGLSAFVPLAKAEVSAREGRASVETWQLALGPRLQLLTGSSIQPVVGAGLGLVWFQVEGTDAGAQYALTSDQLLVPAAHVELGVHFRLSRSIALSSGLCSSLALARPVVEFADRQVLTLGRPLVAATLRIEYGAVVAAHGD